MAVALTGAGGLFTILGKMFATIEQLNTSRGTDVQTKHIAILTALEALADNLDYMGIIESAGLVSNFEAWRENEKHAGSVRSAARDLIIEMVDADNPLPRKDIATALDELIYQMEGAGGETNPDNDVDASTAAATPTADAGNTSDAELVTTVTNGDGVNVQHSLAEDIEGLVTSISGEGTLQLKGEAKLSDRLSSQWPKGSGATKSMTPLRPASGILANGGFDDEDDQANAPDDWEVAVGTIGTTVLMSDYEVQTVAIAGTPTGGNYTLTYTSVDSDVQTTSYLDYNAGQAAVQAALQALEGLENVTVSTAGTSPNYTHTITFEKMDPPGNIGLLTADSYLTGGTPTVTPAADTNGTAHVFRDKCVIFDANGSELTQLRQRIDASILPRTVYALGVWLKVDAYPAAGQLTIDLVDGAGNAITGVQGNSNVKTINPQSGGDLSTSAFTLINHWFYTPAVLPEIVYVRIRISTAISNTASVYIDECVLVQATELYSGGPLAALFAGQTPLAADDRWTIAVTNDRAGEFQEWFLRCFGYTKILLPHDTGGAETIDDALIA